jgi:glycosyltransferase involved in cell wall biosynthesis
LLARYGEAVRCIRHPRNAGASAARNSAVAGAEEGDVAFLDSDDVWLPGKLRLQLEAMRRNGWQASCHAFHMGRRGRADIVSPAYRTGELGLDDFVWGCFVTPGSTMICARALLCEIGALDTSLRRLEDWDWLLRYGRKYRLGFIAEPLARKDPSAHTDGAAVIEALEILRSKHASHLTGARLRHFLAGIDLEIAATRFRRGDLLGMLPPMLKSILRSPTGNAALAAVLHNRLLGSRPQAPQAGT